MYNKFAEGTPVFVEYKDHAYFDGGDYGFITHANGSYVHVKLINNDQEVLVNANQLRVLEH